MDYKLHYQRLVDRAKNRTLSGYLEKHHIIPKCLGGGNSKQNTVYLTPEEHYIAHQFLVKIHPKNHRLLWAAVAMTNHTENMARRNKLYGWLRRKFSEMLSLRMAGRVVSEETRRKMSIAAKRRKRTPHSDDAKKKMSEAARGKLKSSKHKLALSMAKLGKKRGSHKAETIEKIRQTNLETAKTRDFSYLQDKKYKKAQSEKMREIWRQRKSKKTISNHKKQGV